MIGKSVPRDFLRTILLFIAFGLLRATIVPTVSFHELVAKSDQIVIGRVVGSSVSWGSEHKYVWTRYEIAVDRVIKGERQRTVIVSEPGGTLDGVTMRIAGTVAYAPGERVALFLQRFANGDKRTIGWWQGKLTFDESGKTPRGAIEACSGVTPEELHQRVLREMRPGSAK